MHNFIAYRPAILESINALGSNVNLKSNLDQEQVMQQAEEDDSQQ